MNNPGAAYYDIEQVSRVFVAESTTVHMLPDSTTDRLGCEADKSCRCEGGGKHSGLQCEGENEVVVASQRALCTGIEVFMSARNHGRSSAGILLLHCPERMQGCCAKADPTSLEFQSFLLDFSGRSCLARRSRSIAYVPSLSIYRVVRISTLVDDHAYRHSRRLRRCHSRRGSS
jgi:hypothetical protein